MGKVKDEISQYLKQNQFCVLCTCSNDESRATPVRYQSYGLTVNILSEKYSAKFIIPGQWGQVYA